ncbi:MAG TPA: O-antigen ligase family protein [Blastocatellia bacterium]|nr:O-antigen ligase family protein [Blastocatellia bacterium]
MNSAPAAGHLNKSIAVGLMMAVAFTALAHGAVEPWSLLLYESVILGLVVLWAVKAVKDKELRLAIPDLALPVAALTLFGVVQSFAFADPTGRVMSLSKDVAATRAVVVVLIFLLIGVLLAANFWTSRETLKWLANFLTMFGLAMAVFGLVQHFAWNGKLYWIRPTEAPSPFGPFANHNHFAGLMELLIPIPVGLLLTRAVRAELRWLYGFAAMMMSLAVLASLSRGGMISLAASLALIFLLGLRARRYRDSRRRPSRLATWAVRAVTVIALASLIAAGVFWIGADPIIERVSGNQPAAAASFFDSRGWVWRDTLAMIRANPVTGVGLGAYGTAFSLYTAGDGSLRVPQAHNDFLQIVADCGIVGGLLALWFLVLLARAIAEGIRARDPLMAGMSLGCGASAFAILVHSVFDFNLQVPSNGLLFRLLAAVAAQVGAAARAQGKTARLVSRASRHMAGEDAPAASVVRGAL